MSVITVGNFDGVHKGHQNLIEKACLIAEKSGDFVTAVTFNVNSKHERLICENNIKENLLLSFGCKQVVFLDFKEFSSMSGGNFLQYLKDKYDLKTFVCGKDFRFGKGAECDLSFLEKMAEKLDFKVETVDFEKEKTSSSKIRELIKEGRVDEASFLLGHDFSVMSKTRSGKKLGRKLGFPTINSELSENIVLPKFGVYMTEISINEKKYRGISNVGVRPTVENTEKPNIETYVLEDLKETEIDFVTVTFKRFIREEKRFSSKEELKEQISKDCLEISKFV